MVLYQVEEGAMMTQMLCTICDNRRAVHGSVSPDVVAALVAALGADPDTIEELTDAAARFILVPDSRSLIGQFRDGAVLQPEDGGICLLDLTARLAAASPPDAVPPHDGEVLLIDSSRDKKIWLGYSVSDNWLLTPFDANCFAAVPQRRRDQDRITCIDAREVLYGKICEFTARECRDAAGRGEQDDDFVRSIHVRWLSEPQADLQGRAPRDWLLARREFIDRDLQDRCDQWSRLGECPPGLSQQSSAFRFGGFGTNEIVLYYDLVRGLLAHGWEQVQEQPDRELAAAVHELQDWMRAWLATPQEDLSGFTPGEAIQRERQRLPLAVSGEAAMVDCDCPLCQMMADSGPVFWHLDGSHMDEDFAFSFHTSRAEWEQEQRDWEAARQAANQRPLSASARDNAVRELIRDDNRRAFLSNLAQSPELSLFALGGNLAELIAVLKEDDPDAARPHIDALNRDFGNLRQALQDGQASVAGPVAMRFQEHLDELGSARPEFAERCGELQQQVGDLLCADWLNR
jgi:hypothetical protein